MSAYSYFLFKYVLEEFPLPSPILLLHFFHTENLNSQGTEHDRTRITHNSFWLYPTLYKQQFLKSDTNTAILII